MLELSKTSKIQLSVIEILLNKFKIPYRILQNEQEIENELFQRIVGELRKTIKKSVLQDKSFLNKLQDKIAS